MGEWTLTKALAVVVGVVLVVAAILISIQFLSGPSPKERARRTSGVFICEACGHQWRGSHHFGPREFYVTCPRCDQKKARLAVECPACHRPFLVPLFEHAVPLAEMSRSQFKRWFQRYEESRDSAKCPYCGASVGSAASALGAIPG